MGDLAAFVGRNESGKTTILQALTLLNRTESVSDLDLCDEMNEELKSEINIVEGEFELTKKEVSLIKEKFPNLPDIGRVKIIRTNKQDDPVYDFGGLDVSDDANEEINSWDNFTEKILGFLDTLPNHVRIQLDTGFFQKTPPETQEEFDTGMSEFSNTFHVNASQEPLVLREWEKIYADPANQFKNLLSGKTDKKALENFVALNLHPRFVYFSDYKKIYGNINLNEYVKNSKGKPYDGLEYVEEFDKAETVRNLFYLAELDVEEMETLHDSPSRLIKFLNMASNRLTSRLNPAWKGDPIHVSLTYQPGNIMSVVISDVHHDGTVTNTGLLNRRAEGFKWTFSFIVNFAAETQRAELKEAILLLDEPARNLHPTQQMGISDLLKSLAGSNQVLYATHSPFMIFDYTPGNLLVVELDKRKHLSHIFYDYWNADDATLTPILYGLSRGLVSSIVDRENGINSRPVIIVETMSDSLYLNAFDRYLQDPNISMNPLNVIPAYTKNSVLPLAIFYKKHDYRTFVLLDNSEESKQISAQLTANGFNSSQIVFYEKDGKPIQSIEDYLIPDDYLYAVNQTYEIKLRREGYEDIQASHVQARPEIGILESLRGIWEDKREDNWELFDNEEITRYICGKIALDEAGFLTDRTKDNLRSLYRLSMEFSGSKLVQGEPDASSFPSGGLRATFEARGYTAWDPTSPAFIRETGSGATLCIPSIFFSYTGEALDLKTPLLRSQDVLSKSAKRLLTLLGKTPKSVSTTAGIEQEYFLVDKKYFFARPDLIACGRTLIGNPPYRGQELDDHYFGAIRKRVLQFMQDAENQLYQLGVPVITRHNEVAPSQFELASIFQDANLSVDQNLLIMDVLKETANQHGFQLLIHEKPFAGINGSGKHCNWAVSADGKNLLEPGDDPASNLQFLLTVACVVRAVDKYAEALRVSVASASNDHRLGANEAPPAIISIFLGDTLEKVVTEIAKGKSLEIQEKKKINLFKEKGIDLGIKAMPSIPAHDTDRNRTSPFAFTGNKFEFRALGSAQNPSSPNFTLNTIVADSMDYISEEIEHKLAAKKSLSSAVESVIREVFKKHSRIIFNGDNYSASWVKEAKKRGLPNLRQSVEAFEIYTRKDIVDLFEKYNVLSKKEILSRQNIRAEKYSTITQIEARALLDIIDSIVLPNSYQQQEQLAKSITAVKSVGGSLKNQKKELSKLTATIEKLIEEKNKLGTFLIQEKKVTGELKAARFHRDKIIPTMEAIRTQADALESMVDDKIWQLPKYRDILFIS